MSFYSANVMRNFVSTKINMHKCRQTLSEYSDAISSMRLEAMRERTVKGTGPEKKVRSPSLFVRKKGTE